MPVAQPINFSSHILRRHLASYPEVLHAEVEFLLSNYADSSVQAGISNTLQTPIAGEYAHRLEAMQRIMSRFTALIQPKSQTVPILCPKATYCQSCKYNHYR